MNPQKPDSLTYLQSQFVREVIALEHSKRSEHRASDPLEKEAAIMKRSRNWDRVGIGKAKDGTYVNVFSKKGALETPVMAYGFTHLTDDLGNRAAS